MGDFNEPLCGCFKDINSCLLVTFVPCGLCYLQAKAVDNVTHDGMAVPCMLIYFAGCLGAAVNRGKVREAFGYNGSFCGDCCLHCFCSCCAVLQEYREVTNNPRKQ